MINYSNSLNDKMQLVNKNVNFEIPDDRYNRGKARGDTAASSYWDTYGVQT